MAEEVDIVDVIGDLLSEGDIKNLKSFITGERCESALEERASDVIPIASYYITDEVMQDNPFVFRCSEKLLEKCAKKGNPKECYMEFLAQIENLDEVKFKTMLIPIQTTLLRIPDKKAPLMQCIFSVIHSFINSLNVPEYRHVDDKSKLLLDCDENTHKIKDIYLLLVDFYRPFLDEVSNKCFDKRIRGLRLALLQAFFHLLGKPIVFLDLEYSEKGSGIFRVIATDIVNFIFKLEVNPMQFLYIVENKELISVEEERKIIKEFSSNEMKFSYLSMSVFFYLIFHENICPALPVIYDKLFIFQNSLNLAIILLQYKDTMVLSKGLLLTKTSLKKVESRTVGLSYLTDGVHQVLLDLLSNIAVYQEVEENRKLAVQLIKCHFDVFEPKAQYYILLNIASASKLVQILGFYTTILTGLMNEVFTNPELQCYFTKKRLTDLLKVFCSLKDGVETDLIENKSQILSALNLVIFLTVRDKQNYTGIWDFTADLVKNFLAPLREGINLTRAHYKLQLDSLNDPLKTSDGAELAVTVGGKELGKMTIEEKKAVINSGLTVFDLIEHVLSRADESIGNYLCKY